VIELIQYSTFLASENEGFFFLLTIKNYNPGAKKPQNTQTACFYQAIII